MQSVTLTASELFGHGLALVSLIVSFFFYFRSKLQKKDLDADIAAAKAHTDTVQSNFDRFGKTVHDVAFDAMMLVKNVPADMTGMARQRDALVAKMRDIQTLARSEASKLTLSGEFIFGTELGQFENDKEVSETWLVSSDLRPDVDEPDLMMSVGVNIRNGKQYKYVVPNDLPLAEVERLLEGITTQYDGENHDLPQGLQVLMLDRGQYLRLFSSGGIALYVYGQEGGFRGQRVRVIGFDEVVLPNERRGSLWQRQADIQAENTYQFLQTASSDARLIKSNDLVNKKSIDG